MQHLRHKKRDENALESTRLRKATEASVKKRGRSIPPRHPNELGKITRPPSEQESTVDPAVIRKHKTRKEHLPVNRVTVAMTMDPVARRQDRSNEPERYLHGGALMSNQQQQHILQGGLPLGTEVGYLAGSLDHWLQHRSDQAAAAEPVVEALVAHRRQQGSNRNRIGQPFRASDPVDYHTGQRSSGSFRRLAVNDQRDQHDGADNLYENLHHLKQGMLENTMTTAVVGGTGPLMPQFIQTNGGYTAGTSLLNLHKARDSHLLPDITNS